ncbi:MAG TPA: PAS domain S-box protein [Candidatus Pullichristensenella excrementipullorum]|nr:PAS domain S-box protein [Candidatus Pullichristensenella excrementipullorum]
MSSRVAFKAALLALAFMLVILGISAYSLSVDRNEELTESLAFGCVVASELLEGAEDDAQRVAILDTLPEDAKMGLAYFSKDGASLYDNRPGREHMTAQETELLAQAQEEGVIRYQSEADGSLCVLSAFADGSCLRMSRPGVTAFTVFKERLLIYALIVVGVCALVFAMVYLYDMRRRSVIRQVTDVLTDFSDGRYDARVQQQHGNDLREETERLNDVIEQIEQRVFRQRSRDHAISVIMNQMQSGIIVVDARMHILLVTPVARKLTGIAPNSEGVAVSEACKNVSLEGVFGEAMRREGVYTNEVAARTAVGRGHRPLRFYVSPMRQDGKVVGALAMVEDITELRRLEQVRTDFVANVSHELKTPLTSIKGFVETLLDGAINNPPMAEKFLKIIMLEAERLTRLINDILSISKLESGMNDVPTERVQLDKMAFEVADMLRIHAEEKQVTINAHRNKKPVYIIGNPDHVEQMLINLIENAIKYNKPGGSVTVHVFGNDREANVTISDTGIGIPEEHLPRLFERFYRVDKGRSRSMGGTGLGLAIVKHIVRGMNGEIEVHSKFGEGTEFLVTLPIAPPPAPEERDESGDAGEVMDITDEERSKEQRERDESRRRGIHEDAPPAAPAPSEDGAGESAASDGKE